MGLIVLQAGPSTTIQDQGRPGYREFGVPEGGASDRSSLSLANALVGNASGEAAFEMALFGGRYRATAPLALALAGAEMEARIETGAVRKYLEVPQSFALGPGDELVFGGVRRGFRTYLAVRGGWRTPIMLGSRSSETRLAPGQEIPAETGSTAVRRPAEPFTPDPSDDPIRLLDGPDGPVPDGLLGSSYRVAIESDRIGIRLEGPEIRGVAMPDRASAPVAPGAVQVAGGRALILGVAGGTMGGYPHLAHVIAADLDRLGQAGPGQVLRFARVGLHEARRLDRERRVLLAAMGLRIGLMARSGP